MSYKFITTVERSSIMRKIRSNNTTPEVVFRKKLWGVGVRFVRKAFDLPGKPDIILPKYKVAIFIDGEFWHGYNWHIKRKTIKSNRAYWLPKIERNMARDKFNKRVLRNQGWVVLRFWQHKIDKQINECINKVQMVIQQRRDSLI